MPKDHEPEILDPEPEREFNKTRDPKEFLLGIMCDQRLPIPIRMDAAAKVAVYMHPRLAQTSQDLTAGIKIVIEGGLPSLPGTDIIMPNRKTG